MTAAALRVARRDDAHTHVQVFVGNTPPKEQGATMAQENQYLTSEAIADRLRRMSENPRSFTLAERSDMMFEAAERVEALLATVSALRRMVDPGITPTN